MNVKRIKRKCEVRGCRNTDSFALTNANEFGNSVIICKDCLKSALDAAENYNPNVPNTRRDSEPPALFFNKNTVNDTASTAVKDSTDKETTYICQNCNKTYKNSVSYEKHIAQCDSKGV